MMEIPFLCSQARVLDFLFVAKHSSLKMREFRLITQGKNAQKVVSLFFRLRLKSKLFIDDACSASILYSISRRGSNGRILVIHLRRQLWSEVKASKTFSWSITHLVPFSFVIPLLLTCLSISLEISHESAKTNVVEPLTQRVKVVSGFVCHIIFR